MDVSPEELAKAREIAERSVKEILEMWDKADKYDALVEVCQKEVKNPGHWASRDFARVILKILEESE